MNSDSQPQQNSISSITFATEINDSIHDRVLSFEAFDENEEYFAGGEREQTNPGAKMNRENICRKDIQGTTEVTQQPSGGVNVLKSAEETKENAVTKDESNLKKENSTKSNKVDREYDYITQDNSLDLCASYNQSDGHSEAEKLKLYVHSSFLSSQSSYFRALFYSGMRESFSKEVVMKVPKQELQAHITLIEAMYNTTVLDDKEFYHVVQVLLLAHRYDVNLVFKKCKHVITSASLTLEKSEFILKVTAHIAERADIKDAVCDFLVKEFFPLDKTWRTPKFRSLSKASLSILLGSNKLVVQSENTVFVALMRWIKSRGTDEFEDARPQLSLVRFKLMSRDFLRDVVRHHEVAQKMDGFQEYLESALAFHKRRSLNDKPTPRCSYINHDLVFSWVLDVDEWKMLLNGESISSSRFWVEGYEMHVQLNYYESSDTFKLFLFVDNLISDSHVIISWKATSTLFQKYKITCTERKYCNNVKGNGDRYIRSRVPADTLKARTASWTIDVWVDID